MSEALNIKSFEGETPVLLIRVDNSANSRSGVSPDMKESINLVIS